MANETILITKVTQSLKAVVTAASVGTTNLYLMKYPGEKGSPSVNFAVDEAREDPVGSGNFWCRTLVSVHTPAAIDADNEETPEAVTAASDLIEANVFAALNVDDLAARMMAAQTNFTVFGFGEEREIDRQVHGDHWETTWRRMIYCCGTTL